MTCKYHPYSYEENRNKCAFPYYSMFGDIKIDIDTFDDECGKFNYCVDFVDYMTETTMHIDGAGFESLIFQLHDFMTTNAVRSQLPESSEEKEILVKQIPFSHLYKITHTISNCWVTIDQNIIWGLFEIFIKIENERFRRLNSV